MCAWSFVKAWWSLAGLSYSDFSCIWIITIFEEDVVCGSIHPFDLLRPLDQVYYITTIKKLFSSYTDEVFVRLDTIQIEVRDSWPILLIVGVGGRGDVDAIITQDRSYELCDESCLASAQLSSEKYDIPFLEIETDTTHLMESECLVKYFLHN